MHEAFSIISPIFWGLSFFSIMTCTIFLTNWSMTAFLASGTQRWYLMGFFLSSYTRIATTPSKTAGD